MAWHTVTEPRKGKPGHRSTPPPKLCSLLLYSTGAPSETWRFLQGESPCRIRPNQPFVPRVAVMKENAKTGSRYTVVRENLGVEEGTTATSTSLETL